MGNAVPNPEKWYWLMKLKYSQFSILNTARGEKTRVVQYTGDSSKKWKLKCFYWLICSSWKLLEMYKLDIQNWFVHSVCYTDSWSHLRERERENIIVTYRCSHRCRHQKVWIHSSLKVKPKQNWTPWYTEMPSPASHTNPAPVRLSQHCLWNSTPFPRVGAVWGGKCPGVGWFLQGVQAVSEGSVAHPAGPIPGEAAHRCAQRPCNAPSVPQHHPKLMTACLEMDICWFQACSTSQGWFHSSPRAAGFTTWNEILVSAELLISLPRLFLESCSH